MVSSVLSLARHAVIILSDDPSKANAPGFCPVTGYRETSLLVDDNHVPEPYYPARM